MLKRMREMNNSYDGGLEEMEKDLEVLESIFVDIDQSNSLADKLLSKLSGPLWRRGSNSKRDPSIKEYRQMEDLADLLEKVESGLATYTKSLGRYNLPSPPPPTMSSSEADDEAAAETPADGDNPQPTSAM